MNATAAFTFARPCWARGTVTAEDARFLHDLVVSAEVTRAVEIGVASGCSSVVLLEALHAVAAVRGGEPRLHAFDIRDRCYFAPHKPTGAWVAEHAPHLRPAFDFVLGDASDARRLLAPGSIPFAFIDGCHDHPSPVLDFMALLPALTPTAWVVFHDVWLAAHEAGSLCGRGPAHVVDAWPYEKRVGGHRHITAALRLPGDHAAVAALWPAILDRAWETTPPAALLDALGIAPRDVGGAQRAERLLDGALKSGRAVAVWGTGAAARALAERLARLDIVPTSFVDRTSSATTFDGRPVVRPEALRAGARPAPLVLVTGVYRAAIADDLTAAGWLPNTDYLVVS